MIDLKDFFHLPEVDVLLAQIVNDLRGITVIAGLGARSPQATIAGATEVPLSQSDRATIAAIVVRQVLDRSYDGRKRQAVVVGSDRNALRVANHQRRQVEFVAAPLDHVDNFTTGLQQAMMRDPDLLVIDRLNTVTAPATFHAAATGRRILTQIDTALAGGEVLQEIVGLGCSPSQMSLVAWVIAVQRVPALCSYCKQPHQPGPTLIETMAEQHGIDRNATFYTASGCRRCRGTGYMGELTAFDIFRVHGGMSSFSELVSTPSLLPLAGYVARLASQGYVALEDAARTGSTSLRKALPVSPTRRDVPDEAARALDRKLVEMETANKLLAQRIEALSAIHQFSVELVAANAANEARRAVRLARELAEADRVALYAIQPSGECRIVAVEGWDAGAVGARVILPASMLERGEPEAIVGAPPGIDLALNQVHAIQGGVRVPLIAGDDLIGLLILSSLSKSRFTSGSLDLLKMIGDLLAASMMRTRADDAQRAEIDRLNADHTQAIQSARLAGERELLDQLHKRLLPARLPSIEGYQFTAEYRPAPDFGCDVYAVIDLSNGRLGLLIADVDGRGWDAAFDMSIVHTLIAAEAQRTTSPRAALEQVHRALRASGRDVSLTTFYGILEISARHLVFCRAGHPSPLWLRADGQTVLIGSAGSALGMLAANELDLAEGEIFLSPGDTLLLYTNGLTDALDQYGAEFGSAHWVRRAQENAGLPIEQLCAALLDEVAEFQAGARQLDDMALLALRVPNE